MKWNIWLIWLMWVYGLIMSFTLLTISRVGGWMLTSYIPWLIIFIYDIGKLNTSKTSKE
jgi:hypothetical protein